MRPRDYDDLAWYLKFLGYNDKTIKVILSDNEVKSEWQKCQAHAEYIAKMYTRELFDHYLRGRIAGNLKIPD